VPLKEGDVCTRPRYAKTLETIARDGPDAFYVGAMAARTAKAVQQRGGILTEKDLADCESSRAKRGGGEV
jgi:gamma-glutamyltranspeptidase/glutathione hydrolase